MHKSAIIIFIKNPVIGQVKKRLAHSVGQHKALDIYTQMLAHTLQVTRTLSTDKFLYYNNEIAPGDQWPDDVYHKKVQKGATMAQRIENAFKDIFALGYSEVITIGSDCLDLDERIIRLAFRQLEHFDTVIGPTKDGGLYLLGMTTYLPQLLQTNGWGTPQLAGNIQKTIGQLGKTEFLLPEMHSVITVEDLNEDLKTLIQ